VHQKSDEDLMRLVRGGQRLALEALYDRYVKLVYAFARKASDDEQTAKEIVQGVFLRLWTTKAEYRAKDGLFVNWLLTVARNVSIDLHRSRRRRAATVPLEAADRHGAGLALADDAAAYMPEIAVAQSFVRDRLREACSLLSESQAKLIDLVYWQGYTLREAAELSDEPLGTVKNRLHQALKILRRHLHMTEEGLL
jgi:RNA polymerase sigma-70 factor (ECF subfamily)